MTAFSIRILVALVLCGIPVTIIHAADAKTDTPKRAVDIRRFTQHFVDVKVAEPWTFVPAENIQEASLSEHRGLVTIREAGKGQDVKGLLAAPIRLDEDRPPWEFHLGIMQNPLAMKGLSEQQINYAIGLNQPIGMLIQLPDENHLRVGFRSDVKADWTFSSTFDSRSSFGRIAKFAYPCLVSFQGRGVDGRGWGAGNFPNYQKFQIDYVHFRYGQSQ